jgi:hypothetical protein
VRIIKLMSLLGCLALGLGCNALAETPKSVVDDAAFIAPFRSEKIANLKVTVAPVKVSYKSGAFDGKPSIEPGMSFEQVGAESSESEAKDQLDVLLAYDPPLDTPDLEGYEKDLKAVLSVLFEKTPDFLGEVQEYRDIVKQGKTEDVSSLCRLAEVRGSQLLMTTEILSNRLSYKGMTKGGWSIDLALTFAFFPLPFHCWVGNEFFDFERQVRIRCYDVRNPKEALYDTTVKGRVYEGLHEFQHGFVFLNPVRALWDKTERFEKENWEQVHALLSPHLKANLQKNLLLEFGTRLGGIIKTPTVRRRLELGNPDQSRLYAVVVGKNYGSSAHAETDAKSFYKLLQDRSAMKESYGRLFTGKIDPKELISHIENLATKEVDRVVFYFAGQGRQELTGRQELVLGMSKYVTLDRLGDAFAKIKATNVAFILDTSFGSFKRGQSSKTGKSRGGRSALGSATRLAKDKTALHLNGLQKRSDWQVLCATPHDGVTGEYRGQGILTGLLLNKLNQSSSELGLIAVYQSIQKRYSQRVRSQFGFPYPVVFRAVGLKREFLLVTRARSKAPAKKPGNKTGKKDQ